MTLKKSLLTIGTAGVVAFAGAGVASAADTDTDTDSSLTSSSSDSTDSDSDLADSSSPTAGSAELSANRDVFGSVTDAEVLGSFNGDQISFENSAEALAALAAVGVSTYYIARAYNTVVDASDTYQQTVQDTLGFLAQNGVTLPN